MSVAEEFAIGRFLDLVGEMFDRSDYLLPLAAAQRQFRNDAYQMASAAQLEDLFFDAFGMFLRENHPGSKLERRTGSEAWDYEFEGLQLSHKEATTRNIAVWWTAGDLVSKGKYVPKAGKDKYTSPHPFVLVYTGHSKADYVIESKVGDSKDVARIGTLVGPLGSHAILKRNPSPARHALVIGAMVSPAELEVEHVFQANGWTDLGFPELWPRMGGEGLNGRDLWLDQKFADSAKGLNAISSLAVGERLKVDKESIHPGVYVLETASLHDLPLIANNRAHSIESDRLDQLLREALYAGNFRPFPTWFAYFASTTPANLYAQQRAQYEALFAARTLK